MAGSIPQILNRRDFYSFLPNTRSVKAFEDLFTTVSTDLVPLVDLTQYLEFPTVSEIVADVEADTSAHVIIAQVTGLVVTLPKCSIEIKGKVWFFTLGVVGDLTVQTKEGDSIPTPLLAEETTIQLTERGSTITLRCISNTQWVFS
jgi:hypothetical protein